jgi:hypothetical protein
MPEEHITVAEQAQAAGATPPSTTFDPLDELRAYVTAFIMAQPGDPDSLPLMHARMKLEELIHWIRAHQMAAARNK